MRTLEDRVAAGLKVQVNTAVMPDNARELARGRPIKSIGVHMWEVFFLVNVGRGVSTRAIGADEHEAVCRFLVDASRYGFLVRTVEGPLFRRVVAWRRALPPEADAAATFRLGKARGQSFVSHRQRPTRRRQPPTPGSPGAFRPLDGGTFDHVPLQPPAVPSEQ